MRIRRQWGNIENFRNEFGINKPKFRLHPNTTMVLGKRHEKRRLIKKRKKEVLLRFIEEKGPVKSGLISKELGVKPASLWIYLNELIRENLILRVGIGAHSEYIRIKQP